MKDWTRHHDVNEMLHRLMTQNDVTDVDIRHFANCKCNASHSFIECKIMYFITYLSPIPFFDEWPEIWEDLRIYYEFLGIDFIACFDRFLTVPVEIDDN